MLSRCGRSQMSSGLCRSALFLSHNFTYNMPAAAPRRKVRLTSLVKDRITTLDLAGQSLRQIAARVKCLFPRSAMSSRSLQWPVALTNSLAVAGFGCLEAVIGAGWSAWSRKKKSARPARCRAKPTHWACSAPQHELTQLNFDAPAFATIALLQNSHSPLRRRKHGLPGQRSTRTFAATNGRACSAATRAPCAR